MKNLKRLNNFVIFFFGMFIFLSISALISSSENRPIQNPAEEKILTIDQTAVNNIFSAIKNESYSSWKELIEAQLTQENFDKLVYYNLNRTKMNKNMTKIEQKSTNFTAKKYNSTNDSFEDYGKQMNPENDNLNHTRNESNLNDNLTKPKEGNIFSRFGIKMKGWFS